MALKAHTKVIGGNEYVLNTIPTTAGLQVASTLVDIIGEGGSHLVGVMSALKGLSKEAALDSEIPSDSLAKVVKSITSKIAEPRTIDMVKLLLTDLRKDGEAVVFDIEFSAGFDVLFGLVAWSLENNFKGFLESDLFEDLIGQGGQLLNQLSTGESGD